MHFVWFSMWDGFLTTRLRIPPSLLRDSCKDSKKNSFHMENHTKCISSFWRDNIFFGCHEVFFFLLHDTLFLLHDVFSIHCSIITYFLTSWRSCWCCTFTSWCTAWHHEIISILFDIICFLISWHTFWWLIDFIAYFKYFLMSWCIFYFNVFMK